MHKKRNKKDQPTATTNKAKLVKKKRREMCLYSECAVYMYEWVLLTNKFYNIKNSLIIIIKRKEN